MAKSIRQPPNDPQEKTDDNKLSQSDPKKFDGAAEKKQNKFSVRDVEDVDTGQEKDDHGVSNFPPKGMDA